MYSLDYNITVDSLNVPDKRTEKTTAFNKGLVAQVSNLHTQLFETYKNYTLVAVWSAGTYNRADLVRYGKSIFQAQETTTSEPTFSDAWLLVSNNYLGNDFRLKIRGEKLNLEYALNTWFDTVFRQPPLVSDIYIETNSVSSNVFIVGLSEDESSSVSSIISSEFVINSYTFTDQYNLSIKVPVAVYNALAATNDIRDSIIRNFADKYINAGLTYDIITY
jgi:hypothetical protein